ncbi:crotonobetainyl-CoA:carnitine CoA-transferase CaiB-like acyl-CoA transferase [Spinactinospora alkalitolerans]|uniref:Crotonobetainyl-CoA:carnitine CoA-transferase CaiB-like acyl-CoA transferase n=1 Tax=Spinactinospora alkalitolerans TaxID=687207 RepID=A0A852U2N7_9ACTN|nr:CaiB/BaiF CoA-transferase family protein [Spinactinospora alkalitolerans]NYE48220.1 crotonobetainyl-CoA:carnitine CoA-transferase CaiB-like acyl-CoA transferase [Spinactinospora alkalitolerans]
MGALDGVTVVSVEQAVAAPFATRQLADLGARVIKVERPGAGDFARGYDTTVKGMSSHFVWLNRSKESLALDIKDPGDAAVLARLVDRADVFVQNLAPGAAERRGLGAPELRRRNPRLITCQISGYGASGPYRDKKAYDLLVQCEAGLVSITGTEEEPAKAGISVADISAGMYAYSGILAALYERERTGTGTHVDVAMLDALGEWMGYPYYYAGYGGTAPARTGARHAAIAPYGPFRAGDGGEVFLAVQNDREWRSLCERVLRRPALAEEPDLSTNTGRVRHQARVREAIEAALADLTSAQALERLDAAGIANARLRTLDEFAEHPQLAARDRWREVDSPAGPLRALLPPALPGGAEPRMDPVPDVGEHNTAILAELGLAEDGDGGARPSGAKRAGRP